VAQVEYKAIRVLPEHKVQPEHKVLLEQMEQMDRKVIRDSKVSQGLTELMDRKEVLVLKV
jgi:hypothetical protein